MSSYFNLTLDTLAPAGLTMVINDDALYATTSQVTLTIGVTDDDTTGYQMKIWGIEGSETEATASWETFTTSKAVTLSGEDGLKTVSIRVRDDVGNETGVVTDTITLNTVVPEVTISGPDKDKISTIVGFDTAIINFMSNVPIQAYRVCVVPATSSTVNAGTLIGIMYGSTNTQHSSDAVPGEEVPESDLLPANTNIEVTIKGGDLEEASGGDGVKIVKVFVQDVTGRWSVA